jgi:hypothetical protein
MMKLKLIYIIKMINNGNENSKSSTVILALTAVAIVYTDKEYGEYVIPL